MSPSSEPPTPPSTPQPPGDAAAPPADPPAGTAASTQTQPPHRRRQQQLPRHAGQLAMWLFLASLGMLFAASMVGYLIIRIFGSKAPPLGESVLTVPATLWVSTALMLLSSFTIHNALRKVRREKLQELKAMLVATLALALGFIILQVPALWSLLSEHRVAIEDNVFLFGLIFVLILLHAAHVVGGVIPLGVVTARSFANRYDHEYHGPVLYTTMYWHFLDAVWLVMFGVFLLSA